jgi:hypothetical protein
MEQWKKEPIRPIPVSRLFDVNHFAAKPLATVTAKKIVRVEPRSHGFAARS